MGTQQNCLAGAYLRSIQNHCFGSKVRKIIYPCTLPVLLYKSGVLRGIHLSCLMRKPTICICQNKGADQFAVTAKLISAFVFATRIVQFLYFLNPKFPVSSHLLCLYSPVCVGNHIVGFPTRRLISGTCYPDVRHARRRGSLAGLVFVLSFCYINKMYLSDVDKNEL